MKLCLHALDDTLPEELHNSTASEIARYIYNHSREKGMYRDAEYKFSDIIIGKLSKVEYNGALDFWIEVEIPDDKLIVKSTKLQEI